MSDQEMHFADPDWQPRRQATPASPPQPPVQPINDASAQPAERDATWAASEADRDKIGGTTYSSYEAGYQGSTSPGTDTSQATGNTAWQQSGQRERAGQASRRGSQQRRWSRSPWLWSLIVLLILLITVFSPIGEDTLLVIPRVILLILALSAIITFLAFVIQRGQLNSDRDTTETHTFTVGAQPKILVKDDVGVIHVHSGGEERQVVVRVTRHALGIMSNPSRSDVQYEQNFEKNRVSVKANNHWHFLGRNSIYLDITVPRLADLDLKTEAGSITVNDVRGQMSLASDAGSVKAERVMLRGDSRLKTDAGSITFSGSLHPGGSYSMATDAGGVNVTLPADASFRIDAKTDVGSINSHFPLAIKHDFPGAKARGDIGTGPYPPLKLRTDVGSINVWQG